MRETPGGFYKEWSCMKHKIMDVAPGDNVHISPNNFVKFPLTLSPIHDFIACTVGVMAYFNFAGWAVRNGLRCSTCTHNQPASYLAHPFFLRKFHLRRLALSGNRSLMAPALFLGRGSVVAK